MATEGKTKMNCKPTNQSQSIMDCTSISILHVLIPLRLRKELVDRGMYVDKLLMTDMAIAATTIQI